MKKFTLVAAAAAVVLGANAGEYNVDPTAKTVIDGGEVAHVYPILLDPASTDAFVAAGAEITSLASDDVNIFVDVWAAGETLAGGANTLPGVGDHFEGYLSFDVVAPEGWAGGGYRIANAIDLSKFNADTRFHCAYATCGTAPASLLVTILDNGKFVLGPAVDDNGTVVASAGDAITDDWQAIDISLGDLKKLFPAFDYSDLSAFKGYEFSFAPSPAVPGNNFCFDSVYFYNRTEATEGVADIVAAEAEAAPVYYNLQGVRVANPTNGAYIKVCGNKAEKVLVK